MQTFRTVIPICQLPKKISHDHSILLLGSCFSEHIGSRLKANLFNVTLNPTGILFNPGSIASTLSRIIEKKHYCKEDLFFHEGLWKNFDFHSSFSAADPVVALTNMNASLQKAIDILPNLDFLFLTFGTAFVYWHRKEKKIVANCHKLPESDFSREQLYTTAISHQYNRLFSELETIAPKLHIILTVSPVRHLRNDPHENQVSKSHLITAVYELHKGTSNVHYFPSFEIMMDELRDYRFYDNDMAHPSDVAIDYIWGRFIEASIGQRSKEFIIRYAPVLKSMSHKVTKTKSPETLHNFKNSMLDKIDLLKSDFPEADLKLAYDYFSTLSIS